MRRKIKVLLPILTIVVIVACNDLFNKNNNDQPTLHFTATAVNGHSTKFNGDTLVFHPLDPGKPYPQQNPPFESKINKGQIKISGYFMSPCVNWEPVGNMSTNKNTVQITIKPHKSKVCADMPSGIIYDAYISNLSKGNYNITIIHQDDILRSFINEKDTVFTKKFVIK